ncbi:MAG: EAL domain-containing protein [Acidobacteria bacterium]|nr:EAL domain-containing protein [Acidobacteriota bacterium]MCI0624334.1 EAL domain-containing protein [Acidobacteriota bacterium]
MNQQQASLLVVDDNEMNRDALSRRLERKGYAVEMADGGQAALHWIGQRAFDLVLLDIEMPGISGLDLLKILRGSHSPTELPVIMVTAKTQSSDIVEALRFGANDYVTKPIDFPVALARIQTQLSHKGAVEALRESEERYALAMNGANDGLWDWNLKTNTIYLSTRWKTMLGCAESEVSSNPDEWFKRVHPDDLERVKRAIAAHLEGRNSHYESEHRILHQDGSYRWVLSRGLAVRDAGGTPARMAGSQTDVTEGKVADPLTGLPNRLLFVDLLDRAIKRARRRKDYLFALFYLNLDRFKVINDSLGHLVGDQLLIEIAQRLESCLRSTDAIARHGEGYTVARLGGDEFTILLDDIRHVSDATRVAERLQKELALPFSVNGQEVFTSATFGIAVSATGYERPEDLLRDAHTALYRAKAFGGNSYELFDPAMRDRAVARMHLETDLRKAIERAEFRIAYQPIISLATGNIHGFEALVRWQHPDRGIVSPGDFIPIAEETKMILAIGATVLREACGQMKAWQCQFGDRAPAIMSVNLSSKQLAQPGLIEEIEQTLQMTGLQASHLKLEITESSFMDSLESAIELLQRLRKMGIQLGIDDFGTGYSSLSYLYRLPVHTLKVDRSFVSRMGANGENSEIVRTIISLAHNLNLDVIAEGVETADQKLQLQALGCEYGQGYYFSRPIEAPSASALIAS